MAGTPQVATVTLGEEIYVFCGFFKYPLLAPSELRDQTITE